MEENVLVCVYNAFYAVINPFYDLYYVKYFYFTRNLKYMNT